MSPEIKNGGPGSHAGDSPPSNTSRQRYDQRTFDASTPRRLSIRTLADHAVEYARHHWPVFPLRGKIPAVAGGRGVLDATTDVEQVMAWWSGPYRGANIGGRVPESMFVLDVDPRHGGDRSIAALEIRHGALPETLMTISGRGDGGRHLFYRRPSGRLPARRLGAGVDIKTSSGYVVLAPSIHPETGQPYQLMDAPVAAPPEWLIELLTPETITLRPEFGTFTGPSIADTFGSTTSWANILEPRGWRCLDVDPDADGARWLHPAATSACSATIRNGCMFVYSTSTPFDVTEPGNPRGYTRFRAYAVLNNNGDLRAAAQALRGAA